MVLCIVLFVKINCDSTCVGCTNEQDCTGKSCTWNSENANGGTCAVTQNKLS